MSWLTRPAGDKTAQFDDPLLNSIVVVFWLVLPPLVIYLSWHGLTIITAGMFVVLIADAVWSNRPTPFSPAALILLYTRYAGTKVSVPEGLSEEQIEALDRFGWHVLGRLEPDPDSFIRAVARTSVWQTDTITYPEHRSVYFLSRREAVRFRLWLK